MGAKATTLNKGVGKSEEETLELRCSPVFGAYPDDRAAWLYFGSTITPNCYLVYVYFDRSANALREQLLAISY
ncbi:hypothetical protein [Moorena sp. SIO2C4]|uniref:hypothetical protein n=1 Tax=Moorena sp. SIO2C4 TaxID=2607824 RepID=UPI0013C5891B|nr:hypothetical protein [Moorena sp. SIO2C4]NEP49574.1 hypothetical protein [Moorena sp. SIO3C2]NES43090.1 hypothetical protein [Moorena sp. SIO2C4]